MIRKTIVVMALIVLLLSLWPPTLSLYELTGEEAAAGQVRGIFHWLNAAVRPQPDLAPQSVVAYADTSPYGANTFLQLEALPEVREQSLRLLREAGFSFIRQEFPWEDIEIHGKGDFVDRRNDPDGVDAWAKYDNIVGLSEQHEIEIIARLGNPPAWSRVLTDTIGTNAPPDDFSDFGDFVGAVATRYQDQINYYQVWNEPNGNQEWGLQNVDPEAYTRLLCLAYERIKTADPDAVVLAGALTPTVALFGDNLNALVFLERMYAAGAGACFDVMSAQGYGLWSGPTDQRLRPTVINYPYHLYIRDMMVDHGDAEKPIWISEMGWNVVPEGIPPNYGRVTEAQQASYAVEAYERSRSEWPWVGVINYWFFKRAGDSERDQSWYYFRLMEPDFTPLPAWEAMANYAPDPPATKRAPGWVYDWQQARPWLFLASSAVLFYVLLSYLAPPTERRRENRFQEQP